MTIEDIKSSSGYNDMLSFSVNIEYLTDIGEYGIYKVGDVYYKDFLISNINESVYLQNEIIITETSTGYNLTTGKVCIKTRAEELFLPSLVAMGINPPTETLYNKVKDDFNVFISSAKNDPTGREFDELLEALTNDGQEALIDTWIDFRNNVETVWDKWLDFIYSFIYKTYGDASNIYFYSPIHRDDGVYNLYDKGDKDAIISALSGECKDGFISFGSYDADYMYSTNNIIFNWEDEGVPSEQIEKIKSCDIIRLGYRPISPSKIDIIVCGLNINNKVITVADDGATMYGTCKDAYSIKFNLYDGSLTKESESSIENNLVSCTFTNTIGGNSLDNYGRDGGTVSKLIYSICIDSIGWTGNLKPFNVVGTVPNSTPRPSRYPTWDDTITPEPDPIVDPSLTPNKVIIGIPRIGKVIKSGKPSPTPVPPITDELSEDTSKDNHDLISTNQVGAVYNLTNSNSILSQFHTWLWDSTNLDRIAQIWKNNPTDAIYSLHNIYVVPPTSTADSTIVLGNVDTEIGCKKVNKRYKDLKFGNIKIWGRYRDFRDYNATIKLYLPFCNIVTLNTYEVMDSLLYLDAVVDVISGDVLYKLRVNRYNRETDIWNYDYKTIATFSGNCKVDLPYSSNDSRALLGGLASAIGSLFTGNLSGMIGGASNVLNSNTGGSLNGNSGAMAYKTPYLIMEYPVTNNIVDRGRYFGYECNKTVKIGNVKGYAEFDRVHVDSMNCTDEERKYIEDKLLSGVIL